jgi:CheY-like chemotaxis protein
MTTPTNDPPGEGLTHHAPNVLVVDDLPANLLALDAALETTGVRVFRAGSGKDALRLALAHAFAVVLIDVNMPGLDGFETASLLKLRPAQREARVILMSADVLPAARLATAVPGGAEFILKPVEPAVLRSRVLAAVEAFRRSTAP